MYVYEPHGVTSEIHETVLTPEAIADELNAFSSGRGYSVGYDVAFWSASSGSRRPNDFFYSGREINEELTDAIREMKEGRRILDTDGRERGPFLMIDVLYTSGKKVEVGDPLMVMPRYLTQVRIGKVLKTLHDPPMRLEAEEEELLYEVFRIDRTGRPIRSRFIPLSDDEILLVVKLEKE
jgi:hypothetical protein